MIAWRDTKPRLMCDGCFEITPPLTPARRLPEGWTEIETQRDVMQAGVKIREATITEHRCGACSA